jgi:hypothetical protein
MVPKVLFVAESRGHRVSHSNPRLCVALGCTMNVIGEPIDERGPIEGVTRMPIHC